VRNRLILKKLAKIQLQKSAQLTDSKGSNICTNACLDKRMRNTQKTKKLLNIEKLNLRFLVENASGHPMGLKENP
jgi:hypothetical protein